MGQQGDKAREILMDAAEELFATHGIDAVSNRKIAERAGTANHSAIAYHFGNRDELIRSLINRHLGQLEGRKAELIAGLGDTATLSDVIACRVLPWVEQLESMPHPSWRARFLYQIRTIPSVAAVFISSFEINDDFDILLENVRGTLEGIPEAVLRARADVLGHMALGICAEYETQIHEGSEEGSWLSVGYFLIDAGAGMLSAPVTHPGDFMALIPTPTLI
ncbi:TetR/AcrR family transcriptional regulator [Paeniglutamicibacter antarcticus]|uniref:HTH tetR-type domain-containing protein n=1 Tax=Paeniglutamicibacter antarcticus TaxID=494023 RepID=A0ABP9TSP6_9MICC